MKQNSLHHYFCVECHVGVLHARRVTYLTWLGTELITVPNFPAYVCDVCGRREYDEHSIQWLDTMLNPHAGKPTITHKPNAPLTKPRTGSTLPSLDS